MRNFLLLFFCNVALFLSSCTESSTVTPDPGIFSLTGNVQVKNNKTIPDNARVLVIWGVRTVAGDKMYAYGSGSLNSANSFSLKFESDLPATLLNQGNFGMGRIVVTTNQTIKDGDEVKQEFFDQNQVIGASPEHSVIYIKGEPSAVTWPDWAAKFKTGFNVGQGVWKDQGFDEYEPSQSTVEIIIDDLKNIKFPNWT